MIGVGIITYNRPEEFSKIVDSIKNVDHLVCLKDGGKPKYANIPQCDFIEFSENKGVGICKNWLIENLLAKDCEHIFLVEDDCLIKNNEVWEYCISFSKESGLLHFNWNDYRHKRFATAIFNKHKAALCHDTEANFSYFHREFLKDIRFDPNFINAWEHIDIEIQGENKGFLPPFRTFVSPSELGNYLELIDNGISTITGKEKYTDRVIDGHHYFENKWGKKINQFQTVDMKTFYDKMKEITLKYGNR
jgi:hypothetical protein